MASGQKKTSKVSELLGKIKEEGLSSEDYSKIIAELKKCSDEGEAKAASRLGRFYSRGQYVEQSNEETIKYYSRAAELGDINSLQVLERVYSKGLYGADIDPEKSMSLKVQAAESGDDKKQLELARIFRKGSTGETDLAESSKWYRSASKRNDEAAIEYAGLLLRGVDGFRQDISQAVSVLTKAAKSGSHNAACELGHLYRIGRGVMQNDKLAQKYYSAAADMGNPTAFTELARIELEKGANSTNFSKVMEFLEIAVSGKDASAAELLGDLFAGTFAGGPEKNVSSAKTYYELSAELGNPTALVKAKDLN